MTLRLARRLRVRRVSHSLAGDGKSIALPSCRSVCRARIIPAHNLGRFGTLLHTILWGISGHAPCPKSEMPHGSNPWGISLYLSKSKGLNRNPDIYGKAGPFRNPIHHHFGAVIPANKYVK